MESFFFNTADRRYKFSELFKEGDQHIVRVDISNGLVYFDISLFLSEEKIVEVKNLDRMNFIVGVSSGKCKIEDKIQNRTYKLSENSTYLFGSSRQDFRIKLEKSVKTELFILFTADFFIKRYLSDKPYEPINFLYKKLQGEVSLELLSETSTDALSLYLIDKIIHAKNNQKMHSIISEHRAIEYMIHRFSLLELYDTDEYTSEEFEIASKAKEIILQNCKTPPTIKALAHLCATNDFKLKSYFKKVHKTTVYAYVQKLRLEKANLLLREKLLSVAEVANAVGYKHQGHFSSIFFKTYGVYPKDIKISFK
ncbi:MAG: AraC family transcriptional regulator [Epsilonproteobacteria bacterium]|nr:MAG: AraC family transcriptional regulator [Campylobacterota bacterium]